MANPIPGSLQGRVPWGNISINLLKIWLPVAKDTAQANPSEWIIRVLRSDEMQDAHSCMQNSNTLAGFVTTNSIVYSAGPPTFNLVSET